MKLFAPVLAATLLQGTEAQTCAAGTAVFTVTCQTDLMIELAVDANCLAANLPGTKLTELTIGTCTACTLENAQTTDSATTATYCDPATKYFAFDIEADSPTSAAVKDDGTTTTLYFKAGQCGSTPTVSGGKAIFATSISQPASTNDVLTGSSFFETPISCEYPETIANVALAEDLSVSADAPSGDATNKVNTAATPLELSADDLFTMTSKEGPDASATDIVSTKAVTLGTQVKISVAAAPKLGSVDYYLSNCFGTNGKASTETGYLQLQLVKGGCISVIDNGLQNAINPAMDGKSLQFNQFAFVDATDPANIAYNFGVKCDIAIGTAPDNTKCTELKDGKDAVVADPNANPPVEAADAVPADPTLTGTAGRKRRSIVRRQATPEYQQSTEYTVTAGNKIADVFGDIVVVHDGKAKTDSNSGAAVTTAAALMAGTAIMLL